MSHIVEVFLYKCEECDLAILTHDKGNVYYIAKCVGCNIGSFYKKVIIQTSKDVWGIVGCKFVIEEKKDDSIWSKEASKKE